MEISEKEVNQAYEELKNREEKVGYFLNPDTTFTKNIIRGILKNKKRYGYGACPCRLASGIRKKDLDVICPCDYRDLDLHDFGSCYCALYVTEASIKQNKKPSSIPERRNKEKMQKNQVWRCKVCGYLCSREHPPEKCPICMADSDRFEKFEL